VNTAQPDMRDELDETGRLWRRCFDCKQPYYVTAVARAAFLAKGLQLPKRCFVCRSRNRLAREIADFETGDTP
jgi:hypothetical protein